MPDAADNRIEFIQRPSDGTASSLLSPVRRRSLPAEPGMYPVQEGKTMTLAQISEEYEASAALLRERLRFLRQELAKAKDPEEIWHLKRRIAELTPMLTQMNELAELTSHYYERGYYRNAKYTL